MTTLSASFDYFDSSPVELPSAGVGEQSKYVRDTLLQARKMFYESSTTRQDWQALDLKIQEEAAGPELYVNAQKFVAKLPKWIDCPDVDVFDDGNEAVFEWYVDPDHLVNVVVRANGSLYYSGLLGSNIRRAESDEVDNGIPSGLVSAIKRIKRRR